MCEVKEVRELNGQEGPCLGEKEKETKPGGQ